MKDEIELSIVIPAYKEEKRISIILEAIKKYVKNKEFKIETLVVVDGSPDKTAEVARTFVEAIPGLKIMERKENKGKGGTVKEGIEAARGKYIIFTDADNSTPIEQVDKLLPFMTKYEVVIGSRYNDGGKLAVPQSIVRRVGSRVLNIIIQTLAIPGIKDTQCGFKMFRHDAAKEIFKRMTITNFSFDIEVLAIAKKLGYKIREVGITWYDNPHSTVAPIGDGVKMIKDSWTVRKNLRTGKYT
ncbi:MAG: glycosyltransferase family 2 protein [bacterium]|nr:glycosyltransferase family 2 protein [bacterium]